MSDKDSDFFGCFYFFDHDISIDRSAGFVKKFLYLSKPYDFGADLVIFLFFKILMEYSFSVGLP